jgi:hypothetical protein
MKSKDFGWLAPIGVLVLASCIGAQGQTSHPLRRSGVINDYTPSNVSPAGPWEVRGHWSLTVKDSGKANFSAALTMVRSDYWIVQNPGNVDDPSTRIPHTHHVTLVNGAVASITNGFEVTGIARVSASANPPPFGSSIPVVIDVIGGNSVTYSNIKLSFGTPADGHFGMEPLEAVVRK